MGYDLHITRAERWFESDNAPITQDEWLQYVETDAKLVIDPQNGDCFALWRAHQIDSHPPWFDWSSGNIYTPFQNPQDDVETPAPSRSRYGFATASYSKNPDRKTLGKMLAIARHFGARVVGDDDEEYETPEDLNDGTDTDIRATHEARGKRLDLLDLFRGFRMRIPRFFSNSARRGFRR